MARDVSAIDGMTKKMFRVIHGHDLQDLSPSRTLGA
jgi:hypothetical protein